MQADLVRLYFLCGVFVLTTISKNYSQTNQEKYYFLSKPSQFPFTENKLLFWLQFFGKSFDLISLQSTTLYCTLKKKAFITYITSSNSQQKWILLYVLQGKFCSDLSTTVFFKVGLIRRQPMYGLCRIRRQSSGFPAGRGCVTYVLRHKSQELDNFSLRSVPCQH